jgi:hypothetical protein
LPLRSFSVVPWHPSLWILRVSIILLGQCEVLSGEVCRQGRQWSDDGAALGQVFEGQAVTPWRTLTYEIHRSNYSRSPVPGPIVLWLSVTSPPPTLSKYDIRTSVPAQEFLEKRKSTQGVRAAERMQRRYKQAHGPIVGGLNFRLRVRQEMARTRDGDAFLELAMRAVLPMFR